MMYLGDTHLVCGQCTGLVGAYYVCAAESLNTRQVSNDGIFLSHFLRSKS